MSWRSIWQSSFAPKHGSRCFNASRATLWVLSATRCPRLSIHSFAALSNVGGRERFLTPLTDGALLPRLLGRWLNGCGATSLGSCKWSAEYTRRFLRLDVHVSAPE